MRQPRFLTLLLALLALLDLRSELALMVQHFTWTSVFFAMGHHRLAVVVLLLTPWWFRGGRVRAGSSDP
ncbi:MAG: hypothetical protein ACOYMY_00525 [Prochlorococcaceae cyanobacterium]|jgi:hypothetical protein